MTPGLSQHSGILGAFCEHGPRQDLCEGDDVDWQQRGFRLRLETPAVEFPYQPCRPKQALKSLSET